MRKILSLIFLLVFLSVDVTVSAQSCFNVNAGKDTTISCLQSCLNLKARIPNIKSSEDYNVISIAYAPLAYTTPLGDTSALVYADDHFSDSFALPFPFCFYGNTYSKLCVGSNGVFTFDVKTNANTLEGFVMAPGDTIFFNGGSPNSQFSYYAPRASIFLAYYDMNPVTSDPRRKIEWRVEGIAPCRKFVVSYYKIGNFSTGTCPNATNSCTMQAVLYEGTGLIDVFYENKPACTAYQGGLAIAGIQNFGQDKAVALPGKNGTVWTAKNEGYRYVPNGLTSLLNRVELYKNGVLISTGTTIDLGNGELEATFANICQSEDSMSYIVKAFYNKCDNPAIETEGSDTMIVYKSLNPIVKNIINASCNGSSGSITVTSPVAANIEYSIDGGVTWQTSPSFTVIAGSYTIVARLTGTTCTGSTTAIVTQPPLFTMNGSATNATCNSQPSGQVTFAPNGSSTPYQFSANAGVTYQSSNTFTGLLAGSHTFRIKSASGCTQDTTLIITEPAAITSTALQTLQAGCSNNDGQITITASGGTPGYTYSIDSGLVYQPSAIFSGLSVGAYKKILVKDANGCVYASTTPTVTLNDQMFLTLGNDTTICFGNSVTLNPQTNAQTDKYKWTPATGLNADTLKNPVATPNDTTHYSLTATWGICSRINNIWINILHKPVAHAGKDTSICYKTPAFLNGSATNLSGAVNYAWSPATNVLPVNAPFAIAKPDSTQRYTLTVTDNYGCNFSVSDDILVTMRPPVPAFAGNDTNAVYGIPHQLFGSGGKYYLWSPSTPLNNPFAQNPLATLYSDTRFTLLVTDDIGCTNTDTVFIKVYKGPAYYLPNAFTPNGDGINDVFRPIPVGIAFTEYFNIYNRMGELIYQTNQWLKGWDGTYKGKKADAGTYVWIIKGMDKYGKVVEMKGTVILVR